MTAEEQRAAGVVVDRVAYGAHWVRPFASQATWGSMFTGPLASRRALRPRSSHGMPSWVKRSTAGQPHGDAFQCGHGRSAGRIDYCQPGMGTGQEPRSGIRVRPALHGGARSQATGAGQSTRLRHDAGTGGRAHEYHADADKASGAVRSAGPAGRDHSAGQLHRGRIDRTRARRSSISATSP